MTHSSLLLNDLPDELLVNIFKKINYSELQYYFLFTVNKRFHQILCDPIFTNHFTLLNIRSPEIFYPFLPPIIDLYCIEVLPKIHQNIKWLDLDSSSMERILLLTEYPNLNGLGLYNLPRQKAEDLFADETLLFEQLNKNQILSLVIHFTCHDKSTMKENIHTFIFMHILNMFEKLQYLNYAPCTTSFQEVSFRDFFSPVFSSNLLELHINLDKYTDCLYLLDRRLNQLRKLYVQITSVVVPRFGAIPNNQTRIPSLICFVIHCDLVGNYDEIIVPLLYRMINLEELSLNFSIHCRQTFVDGVNLIDVTDHMKKLNQLTFNICSTISLSNQSDLLSNETIQNTFRSSSKFNRIISCVDHFFENAKGQCHIYSTPYQLREYNNITNHFPGGLFRCVRVISLYDEHSFEHEFFARISQSFPLVEEITIINKKPQKNNDDNQHIPIIRYPKLKELTLCEVHQDYLEQFLTHTKTSLPYFLTFLTDHQLLEKVTENFTRQTTRINCSKIDYCYPSTVLSLPKHFKKYFFSYI